MTHTQQQWFADPREILFTIERKLKGDIQDLETGKWREGQKEDAFLNERGRNAVLAIIGTRVNKFTLISNYDGARINPALRSCADATTTHLLQNMEKYEMELKDLKAIMSLIMPPVEAVMLSAKNGAFAKQVLSPPAVKQTVVDSVTGTILSE